MDCRLWSMANSQQTTKIMKLIINADDAGIDPARNEGIFECIDHGMVHSISIIVGQAGWQDVMSRLRAKTRFHLSVGLHFNLTAGKPFAGKHRTLVKPNGNFLNKDDLLQKANSNEIDEHEAARELTAQLEILRRAGIKPTHLDGHNHVHILPGVREAVLAVFPSAMWIRLPWERNREVLDPKDREPRFINNDAESLIKVLNFYSLFAQKIWGKQFRYTDDFTGTRVAWQVTLSAFKKAVTTLEGDVCELMCHPGGKPDNLSGPFSKLKEREIEKEILTSKEFKSFLKEKRIEVISFKY